MIQSGNALGLVESTWSVLAEASLSLAEAGSCSLRRARELEKWTWLKSGLKNGPSLGYARFLAVIVSGPAHRLEAAQMIHACKGSRLLVNVSGLCC